MMRLILVSFLLAIAFSFSLYAQESTEQTQTQPLAEAPPAAPSVDFDTAMRHYRQKHYARAIEEFQKIVDAEPQNAAAWYFMGYAHYVMRHHQEALAAFKKTFEVDPRFDPRPYWRR